jgi:hypothetical protein
MAKNMRTAKYTSDAANEYKVWCEASRCSSTTLSAAVGYVAASAGDLSLPPGSRPRAIQVKSAGGIVRWLVCYNVDAALWDSSVSSITMDPFAGSGTTPVEFFVTGLRRGEKIRRKANDDGTAQA